MSAGAMRGVLMRVVVTLGLIAALVVVVGVPPEIAPATAQDLQPSQPVAPGGGGQPSSESPASEASDEDEESAPPVTTAPSGPAPAFAPSGGSVPVGAGAGASTGSGAGAESGAAPKPAAASQSSGKAPPSMGAVVYENALKDERVFKAGRCFGGKAFTQYVGEGFKMRVMGPCHLLLDEAWITVEASGVTVGDGEVALDFKVVEGGPRARVGIYVRSVNGQLIGAQVHPGKGEASLFSQVDNNQTELASRYDLHSLTKPLDWNRLAVRVNGYDAWVLLNDEPVLYSGNVHADTGKVIIELIREGTATEDDTEESAIVVRDLTLSAFDGSEPGRAPRGP